MALGRIIRSSAWTLRSGCSPIASRLPLLKPASPIDQLLELGAFYLAGADYPAERDMLLDRVSDQRLGE